MIPTFPPRRASGEAVGPEFLASYARAGARKGWDYGYPVTPPPGRDGGRDAGRRCLPLRNRKSKKFCACGGTRLKPMGQLFRATPPPICLAVMADAAPRSNPECSGAIRPAPPGKSGGGAERSTPYRCSVAPPPPMPIRGGIHGSPSLSGWLTPTPGDTTMQGCGRNVPLATEPSSRWTSPVVAPASVAPSPSRRGG